MEPRRPRALVIRHLLRDLELAAVAKVFGDAGGSKRVAANPGPHLRAERPPADHPIDIGLAHRVP